MDVIKKIIGGLLITIFLLAIMGAGSVVNSLFLSKTTEDIYSHPFVVSNAARDIRIEIATMYRATASLLAQDSVENHAIAINKLYGSEQSVLLAFEKIFNAFLGDRTSIEAAYKHFEAWREKRDALILLISDGEKGPELAQMVREIDAQVAALDTSMDEFIDFASGKAAEFREQALKRKHRGIAFTTLLFFSLTGVAISLAYFFIKNIQRTNKEMQDHLHLVDQNIMTATLNHEGIILEVSNRLCRFLEQTKTELLNAQSHFFLESLDSATREKVVKTIYTGENWKGEMEIITGENNRRWVSSVIQPIFDKNYEITGFSTIISDISAQKAIETLSVTDKLTSLFNRRHFDNTISQEIKIARRNYQYLTLAIVDIDFFKDYNDHYGHPAGDVTLRKVAACLKESMHRPNDYVFRLGGEEFGILFSNLTPESSLTFLDRIRSTVEALKITHEYSAVCGVVTVSIGASALSGDAIPSAEEFYAQADEQLYLAKKTRNKVIIG